MIMIFSTFSPRIDGIKYVIEYLRGYCRLVNVLVFQVLYEIAGALIIFVFCFATSISMY